MRLSSLVCVYFYAVETFHCIVTVALLNASVRRSRCKHDTRVSRDVNEVHRSKLQETISGIVKHISERIPTSYRFGEFLIPNPSNVEQVDSGHMTHLCRRRGEAASPHIHLCVCCVCYVHILEYNTANLNPNQWI